MSKRVLMVAMASLLGFALASPTMAGGGPTDRITDFPSVLAVARPDNFPVASLMRVDCAFLVRVERPDGSASETMACDLSAEPVMIPAFQGAPPDTAFVDVGGACAWASDYWFNTDGSAVYAESFRVVVAPSGEVHATSTYPADPLSC